MGWRIYNHSHQRKKWNRMGKKLGKGEERIEDIIFKFTTKFWGQQIDQQKSATILFVPSTHFVKKNTRKIGGKKLKMKAGHRRSPHYERFRHPLLTDYGGINKLNRNSIGYFLIF